MKGILFFANAPLVLTQVILVCPEVYVTTLVARVGLLPQLIGLLIFGKITTDVTRVQSGDTKLFSLSHTVPKLVCFPCVFTGESRFADIAIHRGRQTIRQCKIWVHFSGTLEKWNRCHASLFIQSFQAQAEDLQGFKGGGGRLLDGR